MANSRVPQNGGWRYPDWNTSIQADIPIPAETDYESLEEATDGGEDESDNYKESDVTDNSIEDTEESGISTDYTKSMKTRMVAFLL